MVHAAEGRHRAPIADISAEAADPTAELTQAVDLLLEAVLSVSSDLDLDGILRRTLEAACLLTGAPHGMVAITGERAILYGEKPPGEHLGEGLVSEVLVGRLPYARLHLAPRADGSAFNARERLMLGRLVAAAGQAVGNALQHRRVVAVGGDSDPEHAVRAERERIARDLHDTVIQRMYATGLQLAAARRTAGEGAAEAISAAIADLDATMKDLRVTIYGLRRPRQVPPLQQVEALVEEYAASLGFRPVLEHSGPVDSLLDGDLADHVLATLRETLSNIVKHARATAAAVELHVSPAWTLLRVRDNGVGIPAGEVGVLGSGLANLRVRAERLGGVLRVQGSQVDWMVPTGR